MSEAAKKIENEEAIKDTGPKKSKRALGISKDAALTVIVDSNVKREGTSAYERFAGYLTTPQPTTVAAALENGLTMGDIKYDLIHGYIEVDGATVEEYEVSARGPRVAKDDGTEPASSDAEVEETSDEDEDF